MNINQVKAFVWLVSAAVTAGLGYFVFDFIRHKPQLEERRIPPALGVEYLTNIAEISGPKQDFLDAGAVQRAFRDMNWTGEPPPPEPEKVETHVEVAKPHYDPMDKLLTVLVVAEDPRNPGYGRAWVQYLPASKVPVVKGNPYLNEIRVGQRLPGPLEYAMVKAITTEKGVTFAFDDAEREEESLLPIEESSGVVPYVLRPGDQPITAPKERVPGVDLSTYWPQKSVEIEENTWLIGTEDAQRLGENYGKIIAEETDYRKHRNPRTGEYDGIELKEVKPGGIIASHGAQAGDIIKSINGNSVTSPAEAITYIKNHKDECTTWTVVIENKGRERTMVIKSPQ